VTTFYLGTHRPRWLERTDVPLFISRTVMEKAPGVLRDSLPRARGRWAMDSGGFTQLHEHGRWTLTPEQYLGEVRRARDEIGGLDWAAPMDWMCEPSARAVTGMSTYEHQARTVDNFLHLRSLAPDLPIVPVLQGFEIRDYQICADLYERAGVDLAVEQVVGLGSVCRRQATEEIDLIAAMLHARGIKLHGFGVKIDGLATYAPSLTSADSLAWSYGGRKTHPCAHGPNRSGVIPQSEANCINYAMAWREKILATLAAPVQLSLPVGAG
jgi:hypothetical protein